MAVTDQQIRLFIAIDPPEEAKQVLAETINELEKSIPKGVRWVQPHRIHLTVKFLGNVSNSALDDILTAIEQASNDFQDGNFNLNLFGLGVFPNRSRPRVLWAGVQGDLDSLKKLHHEVDSAVSRLGFSLDQGPYQPHMTLGRPRNSVPQQRLSLIGDTISNWPSPRPVTWQVDSVHLIQSVSEPSRGEYITLGCAPL
jgi:2'-5' RNA ligase